MGNGPTSRVTANGIDLLAGLDLPQVAPGQSLVASFRATNSSNQQIEYLGGDGNCVLTGSFWVEFPGLTLDGGRTWPGVQGDVKDGLMAATGEPVPLTAAAVPRSGCDIVSGASRLAPGESVYATSTWDGRLASGYPAPAGSYEVKVRFLVHVAGGAAPEILTSVRFRVVGTSSVNPPGKAIDIMLSEPKLATWLADHTQEQWSEIDFGFSAPDDRYELEIVAADGQTVRVTVARGGYGHTTVVLD